VNRRETNRRKKRATCSNQTVVPEHWSSCVRRCSAACA